MKVVFSLIQPFFIPAPQSRYPYEWFYSPLLEYLTL
jgi:hypothetical protein